MTTLCHPRWRIRFTIVIIALSLCSHFREKVLALVALMPRSTLSIITACLNSKSRFKKMYFHRNSIAASKSQASLLMAAVSEYHTAMLSSLGVSTLELATCLLQVLIRQPLRKAGRRMLPRRTRRVLNSTHVSSMITTS